LIVTIHGDRVHLQGAKAAGAAGYLLKDTSYQDLLLAIRLVLQGETLF
jgi:DNA-binding NarL/FixJ family response regulator